MRRTLASPNFATSSNRPPAICGEVLSASISTANRGGRCCSAIMEVSLGQSSPWPAHFGRFADKPRRKSARPKPAAAALTSYYVSVTYRTDGGLLRRRRPDGASPAGGPEVARPSFVADFKASLGRTDSTRFQKYHDRTPASRRSARSHPLHRLGGDRYRDHGAASASRPALRGAAVERRRQRRRGADPEGSRRRAEFEDAAGQSEDHQDLSFRALRSRRALQCLRRDAAAGVLHQDRLAADAAPTPIAMA